MLVPKSSRVVICGGGVIGLSVAYWLSKFKGFNDVVVVESQKLTAGTTWHAAGLIGITRATAAETRLSQVGLSLYEQLLQETDSDPQFLRCGSLNVARTPERMYALKRSLGRLKSFGLDGELLTPKECVDKYVSPGDPNEHARLLTDAGLVGGLWIPADATASPNGVAMSLAAGARQRGVKIIEDCRVEGFNTTSVNGKPKITGVDVKHAKADEIQTISCEHAVICSGQWSRQVAAKAGVKVPLHSCEHFYCITKPIPGAGRNLPILRDTDAYIYVREWSGGLLIGGFELEAKPIWTAGVPNDFAFSLLPDDWDHFAPLYSGGVDRIPALANAEIRQFVNGPESFTPDSHYILGEAPEVRNLFVAAGFNSSGIASAGGAGKAIAEWIVNGSPTMDLSAVDIRRYAPSFHAAPAFLKNRIEETLGLHYSMPWPRRELKSGRNLRHSPLYHILDKKGVIWQQKFGWERPSYFIPADITDDEKQRLQELTFKVPNNYPLVAAEVNACRANHGAAIFDQTSFAKFIVQGPDAEAYLQRVCANDMSVPVGRIVYTPLLNERGGYEADVTITRLSQDRFAITTSTGCATRDMHWLQLQQNSSERVALFDITSSQAVISIMGPDARNILQKCSYENISNEALPFGWAKEIDVGSVMAHCRRVTYVGELGYELYVPSESAHVVYNALHAAAKECRLPLKDAGYYAIDTMRVEKGYRAWGHELSPDDNPLECGLGFTVPISKKADYIGKAAITQARSKPLERRLVHVILDEAKAMLWGDEPLYVTGEAKPCGRLISAVKSPTFGGVCVGLAWIKRPECNDKKWFSQERSWQVDVAGEKHSAKVSLKPLYDPDNKRIKQ